MHSWLITGIPRSGTTLLGALVDSMDNSVCLNEPLWQVDLARASGNADAFVHGLTKDFERLRAKLQNGEAVPDLRGAGGAPVTNYLNERGEMVVHPNLFSRSGLSADFTLAIKHNGLYLGALPALLDHGFRVVALIRDPLEVLASWRASTLPVSRGELPAARYFWPEMAALHRKPMALLDKQLCLLELLYRRIYEHEERLTLLRYEDLVMDASLLQRVFGKSPKPADFKVKKKAMQPLDIPLETLQKKIKDIAPSARYYYPES
jgi:hypothetical protein